MLNGANYVSPALTPFPSGCCVVHTGNVGVPIKLLFEAEGMKVTVEVSIESGVLRALLALSALTGACNPQSDADEERGDIPRIIIKRRRDNEHVPIRCSANSKKWPDH